jgi:hypothetical protein
VIPRTPRQPGDSCIFCGAPADSKEHVIPGWISKRLGIKTFLTQTGCGGRVVRQKRPISFASHRKRILSYNRMLWTALRGEAAYLPGC